MSMYWAGYSGIAFVMNQEEYGNFLLEYAKRNCIFIDTLKEILVDEVREYPFIPSMRARENTEPFQMVPITSDYAEGADLITFMPKENSEDDRYVDLNGDDLFVVFADKQLSSIESLTTPLYNTYGSLVNEFKDLMEDYLPKDFDWDSHIGVLHYAAFC